VPVSFEVAPDVSDAVITDEEWLWQMLLNLLTNACKYTDRGSIVMRLSVNSDPVVKLSSVSSDAATVVMQNLPPPLAMPGSPCGDMLLCEVVDTGKIHGDHSTKRCHIVRQRPCAADRCCPLGFLCPGIGISAVKIPHIFDAFAQVQDGQATGTGLGLFGVRTRAEGLGGCSGARHNTTSSTGTGTILWFAIPYVPDSPNSPTPSGRKPAFGSPCSQVMPFTGAPTEAPWGKLRKVFISELSVESGASNIVPSPDDPNQRTAEFIRHRQLTAILVEDTLTVRKLMEKLLLNMGFARVDCYENGSKGLDAMMAGQVDIVFSDVQMPIMTGPEVRSAAESK
jgi:CheY-like chemotaxis protein